MSPPRDDSDAPPPPEEEADPGDDPSTGDGEVSDGGGVTRPIPVRGGGRDADSGGGAGVTGRPTTPTPVRAGLDGSEEATVPVVPSEEVEAELDGRALVVRVRGRSRGQTSEGAADLLLLGFHDPDDEELLREVLVAGRSLEQMSSHELQQAWERSREPRDPFEPAELFPETSRRRGRGGR